MKKDTIIISGPNLAQEISNKNSSGVVVRAIKENLGINIIDYYIYITHRTGNKTTQIELDL